MKRAASITELYHLMPDTPYQLRGQSYITFAADPHERNRWDYSTGPLVSPYSAWGCFAC